MRPFRQSPLGKRPERNCVPRPAGARRLVAIHPRSGTGKAAGRSSKASASVTARAVLRLVQRWIDSGRITLALVLSLFRRRSMKRRLTMKRSPVCFVLLMMLDGSAFSQTAKTEPAFYIVLNSLTKSCTVVDKVPRTDTPNITVATDAIYKTRAEAETAAKTLTPCNQ
jgi:hypothetical protein